MGIKETTEARECAALLRRKVDKTDTAKVDLFVGLGNLATRDDAISQIEKTEVALDKIADLLESMAGKLEAIGKLATAQENLAGDASEMSTPFADRIRAAVRLEIVSEMRAILKG